jgi:aryl-alcohol dehydrogenase-like predicted oxidoreductase
MPRLLPRPFGHTGLQVTPLALGAASMRAAGPRGLKLTAEDVERAFYEHGINTFLFHWRLMPALAEGLRRLIRAGHRDELVLLAEMGLPTGGFVRRGWERHAKALGVDTVDIYLLGWVQGRWYLTGKTWTAMQRLREQGRVRAIGFSSHKRRLAAALAREFDVDTLMIRYNAAHRGAEQEVFGALGDRKPAIIAYTATRWGMLLQPVPRAGYPEGMPAGDCYRFALSHPAVDSVLCAARTPAELAEDVGAAHDGPLGDARLTELRRFGDAAHAAARGGRRWMFN